MVYYIVLILIIAVLGFWVWYLLKNKKESEREILSLEKEKTECMNFGRGLEEYNRRMQEKKEQLKNDIMGLFEKTKRIGNKDVVSAISISKNSAVRYLDELESEGKVKQVGKTGQAVFYEKI
jgi:Fic family protein